MAIIIRLTEADLVAKRACDDGPRSGMALWRELSAAQDEARAKAGKRKRKVPCVRVEWTPLAAVMLSKGHPGFCSWLRDNGLIPYADLRSADLRSADLRSANLRSADLRSADLTSADLRSANLRSADLRSANLRSADLTSANLRSADLTSADLTYASLRSADLTSADLTSADLRSADLTGAWRWTHDPPVTGWALRDGRLVRSGT